MDILGIGNALLDIFCFSDDEIALSFALHPNHAAHVSPGRLDEILLAVRAPVYVSGGSASNAVKAASALGAETAFIGCTGTDDRESDEWARLFRTDLESFGVECILEKRTQPTGRCLVIRMPGGLKAVACSPGAATGLGAGQLDEKLLASAKTVLLDGQVMRNGEVRSRVSELCRTRGIPVAIDIASCDIARQFSAETTEILGRNDVILFMNADETLALAEKLAAGLAGPAAWAGNGTDKTTDKTTDMVQAVFSHLTAGRGEYPCIIEKRGEKGARAWRNGECIEARTVPALRVLDDTGAGDVFAGGFLRAFTAGVPLAESLAFANAAAGLKLGSPGTRLDREAFAALGADIAGRAAKG